MTAHDHREYVEGCFRCDLSRAETAPDAAGIEAALADVLAAHRLSAQAYYQRTDQWTAHCLADECDWKARGDMGGRDAAETAHRAHVAAALAVVADDGLAERVRQMCDAADSQAHMRGDSFGAVVSTDDLRAALSPAPSADHDERAAIHEHEWEVEYLPDPMSAGGVVRSGDLRCRSCNETVRDERDGA